MNRYGRPSDSLTLVGITGTNGKTTSNFSRRDVARRSRLATGTLGTVLYRGPGVSQPAPFTTPTALLLHQTLAVMAEHGAKAVTMEVSSHALALGRLFGVRFRVAAFTNLTQDHLDLHGTMDEYFAAKCQLFHRHLLPAERGGRAVINVDDPWGRKLFDSLPPEQRIGFSVDGPADISIASERTIVEESRQCSAPARGCDDSVAADGSLQSFQLGAQRRNWRCTRSVGGSNWPRSFARAACPVDSKGAQPTRPDGVCRLCPHPDALSRVLQTLRPLTRSGTKPSRLLVVFGCGGDRDAGKRPLMGQAAAEEADLVIVTSDNPRTEQPQRILDMIVEGVEKRATAADFEPIRSGQRDERLSGRNRSPTSDCRGDFGGAAG